MCIWEILLSLVTLSMPPNSPQNSQNMPKKPKCLWEAPQICKGAPMPVPAKPQSDGGPTATATLIYLKAAQFLN